MSGLRVKLEYDTTGMWSDWLGCVPAKSQKLDRDRLYILEWMPLGIVYIYMYAYILSYIKIKVIKSLNYSIGGSEAPSN